MPARALVVLLLMLNLGVAAWWLLRPEPMPAATPPLPEGVARLQLLSEASRPGPPPATLPAGEAPGSTPGATAAAADAPPDVADRCFSFGPFGDEAAIADARAALEAAGVVRLVAREVTSAPRGWRVILPPLPDRATADATLARIRAAGFDDLLVVPAGEEANAIALGRYGSEATARQREAALRAAGFGAEAQPVGEARVSTYLDVAVMADFEPGGVRGAGAAAEATEAACVALQPGAAR
jgi:hypothetical protein